MKITSTIKSKFRTESKKIREPRYTPLIPVNGQAEDVFIKTSTQQEITPIRTNINNHIIHTIKEKNAFSTEQISELLEKTLAADIVLSPIKKFKISDYYSLTTEDINAIDYICSDKDKKVANENVQIGLELKEKLDKKYGEDKYVFVCIGTSPSGIGRVMEFSGVETKYIPISGLNQIYKFKELTSQHIGFKRYKHFLNSQGINRKNISNSDKKFLFYDFVSSGTTLRNFKEIALKLFNLPEDKVEFKELNSDIKYLRTSNSLLIEDGLPWEYCLEYLSKSGIADYGGVPHLPATQLDRINEVINSYSSDTSKKFNYLVIKELKEKGLLRENPLNNNAI